MRIATAFELFAGSEWDFELEFGLLARYPWLADEQRRVRAVVGAISRRERRLSPSPIRAFFQTIAMLFTVVLTHKKHSPCGAPDVFTSVHSNASCTAILCPRCYHESQSEGRERRWTASRRACELTQIASPSGQFITFRGGWCRRSLRCDRLWWFDELNDQIETQSLPKT